jgi:branched-chain amino acid transport system ATP-binding protein
MTILMIEHDMDVALELADRVLVMHQGRKIVEGSAAEVRAHPQVAEIYLGAD